MKVLANIALSVWLLISVGCGHFYKPSVHDLHTNYKPDKVYILKKEVTLQSIEFKWFPTIDNPEYMLTEEFYIPNIPVIPIGSRIQFKKIIHEYNPTMGHMYDPIGILLDPPYQNTPVDLSFISQKSEVYNAKESAYGKFLNSEYLIED